MYNAIISGIATGLMFVGSLFGGAHIASNSFGSTSPTYPVGGTTFYLAGAGVTSSQTTIQLTSFQTPDGRPITNTMLGGGTQYGVLDPQTSKIEDVTFTGVTQNANGTATLTGVTRGNDFVYPYAASSSLAKSHAGGAAFIISNTAGFYGQQFALVNNPTTISAVFTYASTSMPQYDSGPSTAQWNAAPNTALTNLGEVNAIFNQFQTGNWNINGTKIYNANSGNVGVATTTPFAQFSAVGNEAHYGNYYHFGPAAPNNTGCASETGTLGCLEMWGNDNTQGGGGIEMGVGNVNSGANAYSGLFLNNNLASDNLSDHYAFIGYTGSNYTDTSFGTGQASSSLLFFQNTDGAIAFMPTQGVYFYGTTASTSLQASLTSSGLIVNGGGKFMATTTLQASNVNSNALILNGLAYAFPSVRAASSTVLATDANGKLSWESASSTISVSTTTVAQPTSGTASATASCAAGQSVISGGFSGISVSTSNSVGNTEQVTTNAPSGTTGWTVGLACTVPASAACNSATVTVYAVCIKSTP